MLRRECSGKLPAPMFSALADYHVHTPLCHHASGWPAEFARRAVELGLGELGFSDHNPMPEYFDDWRMLREDLPRLSGGSGESACGVSQLTIRIGLECDFLAGREAWIEELAGMAEWDYLIGSVHYLKDGLEVDNPKYVGRHVGHAERSGRVIGKATGSASAAGCSISSRIPICPRNSAFAPKAICGASTNRPSRPWPRRRRPSRSIPPGGARIAANNIPRGSSSNSPLPPACRC